jgi:hypothetical protein
LRTPPGHSRPGAWARVAAFRDAIEDDTDYAVKGIEVQATPDSTTFAAADDEALVE